MKNITVRGVYCFGLLTLALALAGCATGSQVEALPVEQPKAVVISAPALAPTNTPVAVVTNAAPVIHTNTAIIPVPRTGGATNRQAVVLQRAKDNPGDCDIAFIGDSITQGWEGNGKNVWTNYYGSRKCLNFGVGGDRTQHVLWRFENGQLDSIKPKVAVLMIGTNNSNKDDNTEADILEGVQLIVKQMRERLPETKIILVSIFPRGRTFSPQRGKILQVNQALAKLDDNKTVHFVDFGSQLIESDGSIAKEKMPDYLHLSPAGYEIWAQALEPKLKELLAQ
jgi:lysophospholipase L1-like esterase